MLRNLTKMSRLTCVRSPFHSDLGCHYHECFLRGLSKLTCLIRRLPPSQGKATPYPAGEPNLYTISAAYPLPPAVSSNVSARSQGRNPVAEEAAATTSALDQTRHDQTQSENANPASPLIQSSTGGHYSGLQSSSPGSTLTQLKEPPNQDSTAALAASTSGDAPSSRRQSTEVQHSSPFPMQHLPHEYSSVRMTYEAPYQMPHHYAQGYQYSQLQGQSTHPRPNPTNYMPFLGYSGQYYDSSYGQHPTQGQNPQHVYQPSRRPRYRYPPPQLTHLTPGNVAQTGGHLPQWSYQRHRTSDLDTGQLLPQPTTHQGSREMDTTFPDRSWRDTNDGSLAIEPLPYSPRSRSRKESEALKSDSPVHMKPKPPRWKGIRWKGLHCHTRHASCSKCATPVAFQLFCKFVTITCLWY